MRRLILAIAFVPLAVAQRPITEIRNSATEAVFDLGGGSLVSFKLNGGLNPLAWLGPADRDATLRPG